MRIAANSHCCPNVIQDWVDNLRRITKYTQPIEVRPSAKECMGRMLSELYERQAAQNGAQIDSEARKLLPERSET
jgi:hypothetical protein